MVTLPVRQPKEAVRCSESRANSITILIADDDADDRMMAKEALEECRLANEVHFVEDGVELLDYLRAPGAVRRSQGVTAARPDPARPEHAQDGRPGSAPGDQGRPRRCGGCLSSS